MVVLLLAACAADAVTGNKVRRNPQAGDDDDDAVVVGDAGPGPDIDPNTGVAKPVPAADSGPPPPVICTVPNLALCFAFEGNPNDQSPNLLRPTTVSSLVYVVGRENQAAAFGAGSAMVFAPNPVFELPANATVEAWVKRQAIASSSVVFDDDGRFSLTINAAGNVLCKSSGGAVAGTKAVPIETWAHVACVVDTGTVRAYLDGAEVGAAPGAIGSAPTLGAAVGSNSPDGEGFLGLIDSMRVFRVARTAAEISAAAKP